MLSSDYYLDSTDFKIGGPGTQNQMQINHIQANTNFRQNRFSSSPKDPGEASQVTHHISDLSHRKLDSIDAVPPSRIVPEGNSLGVRLLLNDNCFKKFILDSVDTSRIIVLELSFNAISVLELDMDTFPNLKVLNASCNQIQEIQEEFYGKKPHESLEILSLSDNQIKAISKGIKNFEKLTKLSLLKNPLEKLPVEMRELVFLKVFCMDWWGYCSPPCSGVEPHSIFKLSALFHRANSKKEREVGFLEILNDFSEKPLDRLPEIELFQKVFLSIKQKHVGITMSLLKLFPNIIYFNKGNAGPTYTPINLLYKAVKWNNEPVMNKILEMYTPVFGYEDNLLLYTAIEYASPEIVLTLLQKGANPNLISTVPDVYETSPLSYAVQHRDRGKIRETLMHLLNFGANPWACNAKGKNTWHFAVSSSNIEAFNLLSQLVPKHELTANFQDQIIPFSGNTMLHLAAFNHSFEVIARVLSVFENQDLYENAAHALPIDLIPSKRIPVKKLFLRSFKRCVFSIYKKKGGLAKMRSIKSVVSLQLQANENNDFKMLSPIRKIDLHLFRKKQREKRRYVDPESISKIIERPSYLKDKKEKTLQISDGLQFGDFLDIDEHPGINSSITGGLMTGKAGSFIDYSDLTNRRPLTSCRSFGVGFSFKEINALSGFITKLEGRALQETKANPKAKGPRLLTCPLGRSTLYSFFRRGKHQREGAEIFEYLGQIDQSASMTHKKLDLMSKGAMICLKRLGVLLGVCCIFERSQEMSILQEFYEREYPKMIGQDSPEQGELTTDAFETLLIEILNSGLKSSSLHQSPDQGPITISDKLYFLSTLRIFFENSWFLQNPMRILRETIKRSTDSNSNKLKKTAQNTFKWFLASNPVKKAFFRSPLIRFELISWAQTQQISKATDWSFFFPPPSEPSKPPDSERHKSLKIDEESLIGSNLSFPPERIPVKTPSMQVNKAKKYFS